MARNRQRAPSRTAKKAKGKGSGRGGPRPNSGGWRPGSGRKREERRIHDFEELGDPPSDELAAAKYAFDSLGVSLRQVMLDKRLTDRERRTEIRQIAGAMNRLLPKARLKRAEDLIRGAQDREAAPKADPPLEPAPRPKEPA